MIPTPKSLTDKEKEAWEESVRLLNERPQLRGIPAEVKKKWSPKQIIVWENAKMVVKRERKRMYSAAERKKKVVVVVWPVEQRHGEEPEVLAATGKKK